MNSITSIINQFFTKGSAFIQIAEIDIYQCGCNDGREGEGGSGRGASMKEKT